VILGIKVRALVKTDSREQSTTKVLELLHLLFQAVLESLVDEPSMNSNVDMSQYLFIFFVQALKGLRENHR
jgi:hypothetical protein